MIKICFITNNISSIGGQQRVVASVANKLSENEKLDVSILFTSSREVALTHEYKLNENINLLWDESLVRTKYKYLPQKLFIKLYQYIYKIKNHEKAISKLFSKKEIETYEVFFNENKFDILIGVAPFPSAIISMINTPGKKIGWLQSTYERYFETKHDYMWNEGEIYSYMFSKLDKLIVLTNSAQRKYSSSIGKQAVRIYNPLSFEHDERGKLLKNKIVFIGRLVYSPKGLKHLIDILTSLNETGIEFEVDILGDGKDKQKFMEEISLLNLDSKVTFHGAIKDVKKFLLDSSICVVPSIIEGFGLVVTEAMECGIPVISFDTEGPKEIINDGVDGFIIEKFNIEQFVEKIVFLLENKEEREKMGEAAKNRAKDFSAENISEQWYALFLSLINN
ncbi:glycosyltransferase [Fundicoccus sp. Sow4_F4]|uniref:glycosyltransferase n=1 Tax=Fundicoccus sp. Sow4_F4 TaxID=3438783 RepID=UPI003F91ABFB